MTDTSLAKQKNYVLNTHVHNIDGIQKVTGRATYTFDVKMPGMLYGKILRSPHPHAKIISIDYKQGPGPSRRKSRYDRQGYPGYQTGHLAAVSGTLR